MGNYCPQCTKLVGLETREPEVETEDFSDGTVRVEVLLQRECADCGSEMKETRFEFYEDISDKISEHESQHHSGNKEQCDNCNGDGTIQNGDEEEDCDECDGTGEVDAEDDTPDYSLEVEVESTDRTQTHDKRGKPIKRSRYMKTFYGVSVHYTVTCDDCGEVVHEDTLTDECQASAFEDLN